MPREVEQLTSTRDVVQQQKEYCKDLHNTAVLSMVEEGEVGHLAEAYSFPGLKSPKQSGTSSVARLLEWTRAALVPLALHGLLWLTHLCNITWWSGTSLVYLDLQTEVVVPLFKKGD